jgi:hypothetical protein
MDSPDRESVWIMHVFGQMLGTLKVLMQGLRAMRGRCGCGPLFGIDHCRPQMNRLRDGVTQQSEIGRFDRAEKFADLREIY